MMAQRVRVAVAVVAVSMFVLVGCAAPGQEAAPGAVAEYNGVTLTEDDLGPYLLADARLSSGDGRLRVHRALTVMLLGPALVAEAEARGLGYTDESARRDAVWWLAAKNQRFPLEEFDSQGDMVRVWDEDDYITAEMLDVVAYARAIQFLRQDPADGSVAILHIVQDFEKNAVITPRFGDASANTFVLWVDAAEDDIVARNFVLGPGAFSVYGQVIGLNYEAVPEWIERVDSADAR